MVQVLMRRHQRLIWVVIAGVVVITFVVWGVPGLTGRSQTGSPGRLYGKDVNLQEYLDTRRLVYNYYLLFARQDLDRSEQGRIMLQQQTWLRLIERRKLSEWNISVSDEDLVRYIQGMFSENGRLDANKYREFLERQLPSMGIKAAEFEKMMREQLALEELHRVIGATAKVQPTELRDLYNIIHEKLDLSLITSDAANYTNQVKLSDAEVKDYFEKNKESFRIPERRKVRYVRFATDNYTNDIKLATTEVRDFYDKNKTMFTEVSKDENRKTPEKVKPFETVEAEVRKRLIEAKAFQRATEAAGEMALAMVKPKDPAAKTIEPATVDFKALAAKFGVTVNETDFFSQRAPIPNLNAGPFFNEAAFALTPKEPFSDVVSGQDGAYLLQHVDQKPSELPTLDAVKEKVSLRMTQERALAMAREKGRVQARLVRNSVLAAKEDPAKVFAAEAQKLGAKVLSPAPFSQRDLDVDVPDVAVVLETAFGMREGEVSDFIETSRGGLCLLLKRRIPPSEEDFKKDRPQFEPQVLDRKREMVLNQWLGLQYRIANPPQPPQPKRQTPVPSEQPAAPAAETLPSS